MFKTNVSKCKLNEDVLNKYKYNNNKHFFLHLMQLDFECY